MAEGKLVANRLTSAPESSSATSVGIIGGVPMMDLCYEEDSGADVNFNVVMTDAGKFIEVQGTAERDPFSRERMDEIVALAEAGIRRLFEVQRETLAELGIGQGQAGRLWRGTRLLVLTTAAHVAEGTPDSVHGQSAEEGRHRDLHPIDIAGAGERFLAEGEHPVGAAAGRPNGAHEGGDPAADDERPERPPERGIAPGDSSQQRLPHSWCTSRDRRMTEATSGSPPSGDGPSGSGVGARPSSVSTQLRTPQATASR